MLSTRLGFDRPCFLAARFALAFCFLVSGVLCRLGFFFFQMGFAIAGVCPRDPDYESATVPPTRLWMAMRPAPISSVNALIVLCPSGRGVAMANSTTVGPRSASASK